MKYHKNVYRSLAMITQFGINMLVPIFACSFIGIFLDKHLGTSFFMILFFFIGALAGGRNVYVFSKKIFSGPPSRDRRKNTADHRHRTSFNDAECINIPQDDNKDSKHEKDI